MRGALAGEARLTGLAGELERITSHALSLDKRADVAVSSLHEGGGAATRPPPALSLIHI